MKLAEALSERSSKKKELAQLTSRATSMARYQEGEEVAESATELLHQARQVVTDLGNLIRRINKTNSATELETGFTITDAIAKRDELGMRRTLLTAVSDAAAGGDRDYYGRRMRSELKTITEVPVRELRTEADALAQEYRELDVRIQRANWATDLLE